MARQRDFRKEYARRIANATARGLSRSQARGHARPGELPTRQRPPDKIDDRLEAALREFRRIGNRGLAAKSVNVAPERFSRFLRENVQVEGRGRLLKIIDNRQRDMTVISDGQAQKLRLRDFNEASLNGRHLAAIHDYLRSGIREHLLPFDERTVIDSKGKAHPLETDPNELHRIAAQGDEIFHEIYRLVLTGA